MLSRSSLALAAVLAVATASHAAEDFGKFAEEPINRKGSHTVIDDPTGQAPTAKVDSFTIIPGPCNSKSKYSDGKSSDCTFNSVRSQVFQPKPDQTQPEEAWYGWSMYMPEDFPLWAQQTGGLYSFAYWHNQICPHLAIVSDTHQSAELILQTNIVPKHGPDCQPDVRIAFANGLLLRGKWHRFEVHVKWSQKKDDGFAQVFLDGAQVVDFKGRTISLETPTPNYFKYGVYLCCTEGTEQVKPATVLFANVSRAATREGLKN